MIKQSSALLLGFSLLAACGSDVVNTNPEVQVLDEAPLEQTLTDPASGTEVALRPEGQLRLKLDSNPTTGYYWYLKDLDASQLDQLSDGYFADPAPEGVVGSGGHQLFALEALSVGKSTPTLTYQRTPDDVA